MKMPGWITTTKAYVSALPHLKFPFENGLPDVFVPQSTVLDISGSGLVQTYLWCYRDREVYGRIHRFNPESLCAQRVKDLTDALERMSKQQRFETLRPRSLAQELTRLSIFLKWADDPVHMGKFEAVLSDPNLALEALKSHHSYLRQRLQGHGSHKRITRASAGQIDRTVIKVMSTIHGREFGNQIEPLGTGGGQGVTAPKVDDVQIFMACIQGVFDSIVRLTIQTNLELPQRSSAVTDCVSGDVVWESGGQVHRKEVVDLDRGRLMEIGCMAFAALCLGDSGANLAQIHAYEAPDDLEEQLNNPQRLTLKQKVIKFRAGGKYVPVHLTATSFTRLRSYLGLRQALIQRIGCKDLVQMFVQGEYGEHGRRPIGAMPIARDFTAALRTRFRSLGVDLPQVTMQQLRVHRQGDLARKYSPKVAADMTGQTVETAIKAYNKIADEEARAEMAPFLANLTRVVRSRANQTPTTAIAVGECDDYGNPKPIADSHLVTPDCKKSQGCFFCDKYSLHADAPDAVKLMSCMAVLERLNPAHGSGAAEKVYVVVLNRVTSLLSEIKRVNPAAHEQAERQVVREGNLTRYWASKLQQLHMLGLLGHKPSGDQP